MTTETKVEAVTRYEMETSGEGMWLCVCPEVSEDGDWVKFADHVAAITSLEGQVERLRVQLAGCGVIALSNTRKSLHEQMPNTSAYGWSQSLVDVHDAVLREIAHRERADAAERRVAELEAALRPLSDATFAEFCSKKTERIEPDDSKVSFPEDRCHITFGMIRNARKVLTKESP